MKLDENTKFPHPVLSTSSNDYLTGEFKCELATSERAAGGLFFIKYRFSLAEVALQELLDRRIAHKGFYVSSPETYFLQLRPAPDDEGVIEFRDGELRGNVSIRPVIWSSQDIEDFSSQNLHSEFSDIRWNFAPGEILAFGNEHVVNVGQEKLAPMETIFSFAKKEDWPDHKFGVQFEGERIKIDVSENTLKEIQQYRGSVYGRNVLLNAVYLPVLIEVLSAMDPEDGTYAGKRWYKVISAKLAYLGLIGASDKLLDSAQILLKLPFQRISLQERK